MLETHIVMSSLMFRLSLILVFCLARTLVLHLALFLVLLLALSHVLLLTLSHVLIVVIVSRVGLFFPLEGPFPTLSRDTWTVHAFPIVVHVQLDQVVRCKGR
jgi:hypothetical protein